MDRGLRPLGGIADGMSEYQYYKFLALDRPLTDRQLAERRCETAAFSSRCHAARAAPAQAQPPGTLRQGRLPPLP
jgi:molybdopterin-guanine dinucleotide biosynthesis protein A